MIIASGFRKNAVASLLIHESTSCGNMALDVRSLRYCLTDNMDSGKIFSVRMGRASALSKLQVSLTGRVGLQKEEKKKVFIETEKFARVWKHGYTKQWKKAESCLNFFVRIIEMDSPRTVLLDTLFTLLVPRVENRKQKRR